MRNMLCVPTVKQKRNKMKQSKSKPLEFADVQTPGRPWTQGKKTKIQAAYEARSPEQ